LLPQDQEESEIKKKFFDHREFNLVWANRDLEDWMNNRQIYSRGILIPKALELNIVLYPYKDDHDFIYLTSEFYKFNREMESQRKGEATSKEKLEGNHLFIEYHLCYTIAKYIGLSYEQFCKLPTSSPDLCRLIFDLEDLVFRLINAEKFMERSKDQDEMMLEREEFRKRIVRK
jgi:hypothetical protein